MHKAAIFATALVATAASAEPSRLSQHPRDGELCEIDFQVGSARIPTAQQNNEKLGMIAGWAQEHPEGLIVLDGHADRSGEAPQNVRLSMRRAASVRDELVGLGVDPDRIVMAAFGSDGPQRSNIAENRRVTVWGTRERLEPVVAAVQARGASAVVWGTRPSTIARR